MVMPAVIIAFFSGAILALMWKEVTPLVVDYPPVDSRMSVRELLLASEKPNEQLAAIEQAIVNKLKPGRDPKRIAQIAAAVRQGVGWEELEAIDAYRPILCNRISKYLTP